MSARPGTWVVTIARGADWDKGVKIKPESKNTGLARLVLHDLLDPDGLKVHSLGLLSSPVRHESPRPFFGAERVGVGVGSQSVIPQSHVCQQQDKRPVR